MSVASLYTSCFVMFCVFCTGHFVMVPINWTCPHCLQHFFFEHIFHLYFPYRYLSNRVIGNCSSKKPTHFTCNDEYIIINIRHYFSKDTVWGWLWQWWGQKRTALVELLKYRWTAKLFRHTWCHIPFETENNCVLFLLYWHGFCTADIAIIVYTFHMISRCEIFSLNMDVFQ